MGDLVERLRTAIASTLFWFIAPANVVNAVADALLEADEIERLRARVAELEATVREGPGV